MTEQIRVDIINAAALKKLETFLEQLEDNVVTEEDMLATAYAAMLVITTMGYNPVSMAEDAILGANKLLSYVEEALDNEAS